MEELSYYRNCVTWPKWRTDDLVQIQGDATEVELTTFMRYINKNDLARMAERLGYSSVLKPGLNAKHHIMAMSEDPCVTYHISNIRGRRVCFIRHSAIEYVFAPRNLFDGE